jgi:hypothetical protein
MAFVMPKNYHIIPEMIRSKKISIMGAEVAKETTL